MENLCGFQKCCAKPIKIFKKTGASKIYFGNNLLIVNLCVS